MAKTNKINSVIIAALVFVFALSHVSCKSGECDDNNQNVYKSKSTETNLPSSIKTKTIYHDGHKFIVFMFRNIEFQVEKHPDCNKCNQRNQQ